jgi:hypothetical protein
MREKGQYSKGMIMEFVDKAVIHMLATERAEANSRNTHSTHTHFTPKVLELRNKIIDHLTAKYNYENLGEVTIAKPMLEKAIMAVEEIHDQRTVRDRIKMLESKGYVKESEDSNKLHKRYNFILNSEHLKTQEI